MNYKEKLKEIRVFIFDCDGVFTDGTLLMYPDGYLLRRFNAKDGYAVQIALKKGWRIAIITGGKDKAIKTRFSNLGITDVFLNAQDKLIAFNQYVEKHNLNHKEILYMGDDLPDIPLLEKAGLPCCPNDAVMEVKNCSKYISNIKGGEGCVRDIIEQTLKIQNQWIISKKDLIAQKINNQL